MQVDHIGYAVKNMERAIRSFMVLGYQFKSTIDDIDRNIRIIFGEKDGYRIELVCPLDRNIASPVDTYLSNVGPTPYHICYRTENMEEELIKLEKQGFKTIIAPEKATAFDGKQVAFLMNLGIGLMEIVEL